MRILEDGWVTTASDLTNYLSCAHLAHLEIAAARGFVRKPARRDDTVEMLSELGDRHEEAVLAAMEAAGRDVVRVPGDDPLDDDERERAIAETERRMREGADVIHQATFAHDGQFGRADFLCRVEAPSDLGPYSYEVVDAKLARRAKPEAVLQVCAYSDWLAALQGTVPESAWLQLGNGDQVRVPLRDCMAYYRRVRDEFRARLANAPDDPAEADTYPEPVEHCSICRWAADCARRRRADDHLSLVAGLARDHANHLREHGVATVRALAKLDDDAEVPGIGSAALERMRRQARLQVGYYETGELAYEFLEPARPDPSEVERREKEKKGKAAEPGFLGLPAPSPGDVFFDIEGDPWVGDEGLEYLLGVVEIVDGQPRYHAFWAHDEAEEKRAFEAFVDFVMARLERDPSMHVYHYAAYEDTALKRLAARHGTREAEVDRLLREHVLVDLYRVVRQGLLASVESYSIKKLEPFYMETRDDPITDSTSSVVAYERWLDTRDDSILEDLREYNEVDCVSTWKLQDWLEGLRLEAIEQFGDISRPAPREQDDDVDEMSEKVRALTERLLKGVPELAEDRDEDDRARVLMARLLEWHRREAKSEWWAFFDRLEKTDDELVDDADCLGGLTFVREVDRPKRSVVLEYRFEAQETKVRRGDWLDPRTGAGHKVVEIDAKAGSVHLRRGVDRIDDHPRSLIPSGPYASGGQRDALLALGECVAAAAETGIADVASLDSMRAPVDLLYARPPRIADRAAASDSLVRDDESASESAVRLATKLAETTLSIQGPPGSGKTYTGAKMIVACLRAGLRVGITANSHKVITNLLNKAVEFATNDGLAPRIVQKAGSDDDHSERAEVRVDSQSKSVEARVLAGEVDLVAGTSWLFVREGLRRSLDVLFIDEAGQFSLANALAVGWAAKNMVMLGDPLQLAQPSKGVHPPGADVSALEHVLGEHEVMPASKGLFLDATWRMHPDVCAFTSEVFYEGRLESKERCARQSLAVVDASGGTGVRFLRVAHEGNRTRSEAEAKRIAAEIDALLGREWVDHEGKRRPLVLDDILVVAPYNAQVAELARWLPAGARIGTVDKFQGQEAPVVFYSMTSSSPEDIPRGMDFLFSRNRLNVATSRAMGLAVLVASPELLRVRCRNLDQVRSVHAVCRFIEMAGAGGGGLRSD